MTALQRLLLIFPFIISACMKSPTESFIEARQMLGDSSPVNLMLVNAAYEAPQHAPNSALIICFNATHTPNDYDERLLCEQSFTLWSGSGFNDTIELKPHSFTVDEGPLSIDLVLFRYHYYGKTITKYFILNDPKPFTVIKGGNNVGYLGDLLFAINENEHTGFYDLKIKEINQPIPQTMRLAPLKNGKTIASVINETKYTPLSYPETLTYQTITHINTETIQYVERRQCDRKTR